MAETTHMTDILENLRHKNENENARTFITSQIISNLYIIELFQMVIVKLHKNKAIISISQSTGRKLRPLHSEPKISQKNKSRQQPNICVQTCTLRLPESRFTNAISCFAPGHQ
jgi:hypothetical protein